MLESLYNTTYECTYLNYADDDVEDEKYRRDLLAVFNLVTFDDSKISNALEEITQLFRHEKWFVSMLKTSPFYDVNDYKSSLTGLYNYDQLHETHHCISRHLNEININRQ